MYKQGNLELATQHGGSLDAFAHTTRKLIQPGYKYCADISRQKGVIQSLDQSPAHLAGFDQIFFLHVTDDLFGEIRVSFRTFHYERDQFWRSQPSQQSLDQVSKRIAREATQENTRIDQTFFKRSTLLTRGHNY